MLGIFLTMCYTTFIMQVYDPTSDTSKDGLSGDCGAAASDIRRPFQPPGKGGVASLGALAGRAAGAESVAAAADGASPLLAGETAGATAPTTSTAAVGATKQQSKATMKKTAAAATAAAAAAVSLQSKTPMAHEGGAVEGAAALLMLKPTAEVSTARPRSQRNKEVPIKIK